MSSSINRITLLGNLGSDPEIKFTGSGVAVCNFSIATTNRFKRGDEWQEETEWHRLVTWNKTAEACAQYLNKGSQVYVEGRLQTRSWEDKDGNKRYSTEIVASNVVFLSSKNGGQRSEKPRDEPPPPGDDGAYGHGPGDDDLPF